NMAREYAVAAGTTNPRKGLHGNVKNLASNQRRERVLNVHSVRHEERGLRVRTRNRTSISGTAATRRGAGLTIRAQGSACGVHPTPRRVYVRLTANLNRCSCRVPNSSGQILKSKVGHRACICGG